MPKIKILTQEVILHLKEVDQLAHYIIAKLFVFKLKGDLRKENSVYLCIRYISCYY
jgi:hypothetical protein